MALEKTVISDKLKDEGVNENLGNGLVFETEAELATWVDTYKSGLPEPEKKLQDYTKDEIEELAKDPQFKGAKGLQGYIDSIRVKKPEEKKKPEGKKDDEPPEWAKTLIEDNKKLKDANASKEFDSLLSRLGKDADLNDTHISRVKKGLKSDATEVEVLAEIKSYKAELTTLGIKEFGTPGGGSGKKNSTVDSASKEWAKKENAKKKK